MWLETFLIGWLVGWLDLVGWFYSMGLFDAEVSLIISLSLFTTKIYLNNYLKEVKPSLSQAVLAHRLDPNKN